MGLETIDTPWMNKVGLFIESSRASGRAVLLGVARYAHARSHWSVHWEPGGLERAWPRLSANEFDGILMRDVSLLKDVLNLGIPAAVVGHSSAEVPGLINVVTDSARIGTLAAEHLIGCGFQHFAFCGYQRKGPSRGEEDTSWSHARYLHFSQHLEAAGFAAPREHQLPMAQNALELDGGPQRIKALASWLESLPKPVGLLACNDDCGWLVMEACAQAGLNVPDTVGVIGVDNDEIVCGLSDPPLSCVVLDFVQAGYDAAQALDRLMKYPGRAPARIPVAATHVVHRRSTDFVAVGRRELAKALRFIRDHAREAIRVDDVVRASGVSRRVLEKHFHNDLSRTVMQEIRRVRTDRIAQLLVETTLPITQIADMLGFEDIQHFARYFRAGKKMSPRAYRGKFAVNSAL